jgi:hypothetical protein
MLETKNKNEKQAGIPYGSWRSSPTHRPGKKIYKLLNYQ